MRLGGGGPRVAAAVVLLALTVACGFASARALADNPPPPDPNPPPTTVTVPEPTSPAPPPDPAPPPPAPPPAKKPSPKPKPKPKPAPKPARQVAPTPPPVYHPSPPPVYQPSPVVQPAAPPPPVVHTHVVHPKPHVKKHVPPAVRDKPKPARATLKPPKRIIHSVPRPRLSPTPYSSAKRSSGTSGLAIGLGIAIVMAVLGCLALAIRATARALRSSEPVAPGAAETVALQTEAPVGALLAPATAASKNPAPSPEPTVYTLPVPAPAHEPSASQEPADGTQWETCEIVWWRGYRRSLFTAIRADADEFSESVASSPNFKWHRPEEPPQNEETTAAHRQLIEKLHALGWDPAAPGESWYGGRYRRALKPETGSPAPVSSTNGARPHAPVVTAS